MPEAIERLAGERAGEPREQILGEAAPGGRPREDVGPARAEPARAARERTPRAAARRCARGSARASSRRRRAAAAAALRVSAQVMTRGEGAARTVEREQAVPEDGGAHARDLGRARARTGQAAVDREATASTRRRRRARRCRRAWCAARRTRGPPPRPARARTHRRCGAGGAGADVQRHDEHVRYYDALDLGLGPAPRHSPNRRRPT